MVAYILRRVLYSIPVILIAALILLWGVRETFDPCAQFRTSRGGQASVERCRKADHLDEPITSQYWSWLTKAVQGDLGQSERTNADVGSTIATAMWYTIQLIFWGVLLSALLAIALGVYSAVRQYSVGDYILTTLSFIGLAMPPFWFGLIAIQFLAVGPKNWFGLDRTIFGFVGLHNGDSTGFDLDYVRHLVLPVLTLTVQSIAEWSRFQRASMLDVMSADYVRTARAKGVRRRDVLVKHALRNALIPLVTVMALDIGGLFGGVIITEKIFAIPGMGRLFLDSLQQGDAPMLVAWTVVTAVFVVLFNLIADILYGVLDPRIRLA